jgi:hypothetical protein
MRATPLRRREDQQPTATDSRSLKKTTAIAPLFHIRLLLFGLTASAGLALSLTQRNWQARCAY